MRILITGGSGLLGQYVNIELAKNHEILTLYNSSAGNTVQFQSARIDITNESEITQIFESYRPEVVVHLAAVASVQDAHAGNSGRVYDINVNASDLIARFCEKYNARLFYTSTDLVYAGYRGEFLKEDAKKDPRSLYAETKLVGEEKIKSGCENYVILRTSLLYGYGFNNRYNHFFSTYQKFRNGEGVNLFYDQYRTPVELSDAARMISELIKTDIRGVVINFGGGDKVSRTEMAEILCKETGLSTSLINRTSLYDIPGIPDVQDVSLDISILKSLGIKPRSVEESVRHMINLYQNT